MDTATHFELVPTPREFVGDVYALLARLMANNDEQVRNNLSTAADDEEITLTPALIRRMYEDSYEPHRRLFKFLATRPDEWIFPDDIVEALELGNGAKSLAGMLGAFGRRAKHRYGGLRPFESRWDVDAGQSKHRMTAEVAAVIDEL